MDIYKDAMLTQTETARYLAIPDSTVGAWRRNATVHSLPAEHRGWPTLPFAGVVEAFVLRALRDTGFSLAKVREAAEGIRREFKDPYALVRPEVGHDGIDIFIRVGGELYRARDRQQAIRETVTDYTSFIEWDGQNPTRLRLKEFDGQVILDPRFGWGQPVVAENKVPVKAILGLWSASESMEAIAKEFRMEADDVDRIIRTYVKPLVA